MGTLGDGIGHEPVDADRGKQQGDSRKAGKEAHGEFVFRQRQVLDLFHGADSSKGDIGVDGVDRGGNSLDHEFRLTAGAHADGESGRGRLRQRHIDFGTVVAEIAATHVMEDAHDLPFNGRSQLRLAGNDLLDRHALGEGIHALQVAPGEFLVDDGHAHAGRGVLRGEGTALEDIDAEGLEVVGGNGLEAGIGPLGGIGISAAADDGEGHAVRGAAEGHAGDRSRMGHASYRLKCGNHALLIGVHLIRGVEAIRGLLQVEGEHMVGTHAEIDLGEIPEAVNGQACAGQQRECKREFSDDQPAAQFVAGGASRGAAAGFERLGRVELRSIPGGRAAK